MRLKQLWKPNSPDPHQMTTPLRGLRFIIQGFSRPLFWSIAACVLLNIFLSVVNPLGLKMLFDRGIGSHNPRYFVAIGLALIGAISIWRLLDFCLDVYLQKLKARMLSSTISRLLHAYFALPFNETREHDCGYFVSRIFDEPAGTVVAVIDCLVSVSVSAAAVITGSVVAVRLSWRATLLVALIAPAAYFLSQFFGRRLVTQSQQEKEAEAAARGTFFRALDSFRTVRIFGLLPHVKASTTNKLDAFITAQETRYVSGFKYRSLSGLLLSYTEMSVIFVAGYHVLRGQMSFGSFMAFMNAFWIVIRGAKQAFDSTPEMFRLNGVAMRLLSMAGPRTMSSVGQIVLPAPATSSVHNLSAGYSGQTVLKNVTLEIRKNDHLLITGSNGSGKSTLGLVLSGFLPAEDGEALTPPMEQISAVVAPFIFPPGTVREILDAIATTEERKKRVAGLTLELGITTLLNTEPDKLSAGQKKKCEIATCLAKDAQIYIFDEPLAGIDIASKTTIMNVIERETQNKALLVVMHGDEQFHSAFNRLFTLEHGCLNEITRTELSQAV